MKTKKAYLLLFAFSVLILLYSCVKDLDFEQINQAVLTPVVEADFIYSTFDISEYIPNGLPPNTVFTIPVEELTDTVNYDLVGTDFAIDNLEKIELTIEVRNTIPEAFTLQFQFLSDTNTPIGQVYTIPIDAGQGVGSQPQISFSVPNPIVLDQVDFAQLINAQKIATEIIVPASLNSDLRGVVDIRSKASYYINYSL